MISKCGTAVILMSKAVSSINIQLNIWIIYTAGNEKSPKRSALVVLNDPFVIQITHAYTYFVSHQCEMLKLFGAF